MDSRTQALINRTGKRERLTISCERLFPSGAWECSAFVGGYLVRRRYFFMTKREALADFREEVRVAALSA